MIIFLLATTKYWRAIRRCQKQAVNRSKDVPNPKSIVNDYDYCDYIWDYRFIDSWTNNNYEENKKEQIKHSRK